MPLPDTLYKKSPCRTLSRRDSFHIKTIPFMYYHMYGAFTDFKPFGSCPNGGSVFNNIERQPFRPLLHVALHKHNTPRQLLFQSMRKSGRI